MKRIRIEPPAPFLSVPVIEPTTFEQRYRDQLRARDLKRFTNPDAQVGRDVWIVYAWIKRSQARTGLPVVKRDDPEEWRMVGTRPIKSRRRKPMTMNRLFAIIRRRFSLRRDVPVKLITERDDELRIARGERLAPPVRFLGRTS